MKCNQCGFEYKDTAPYCPRCGAPQTSERQNENVRTVAAEPAPAANQTVRETMPPTMPGRFPNDPGLAMHLPKPPVPPANFRPNVGAPAPGRVPGPVPASTAKTAATALTCSVLGLMTCGGVFHIIALVLSILGFSMGSRAVKESSMTGQEGLATASAARNLGIVGMILAGLAVFGTLLFFIIGLSINKFFIENFFEYFGEIMDEMFG